MFLLMRLLGFFDPSVDFGLQFNSDVDTVLEAPENIVIDDNAVTVEETESSTEKNNIVTLDTFRKKK